MDNSDSPPNPTVSRPTLKLKAGRIQAPKEMKVVLTPQPQRFVKAKPGARWSDDYKERMQAEMDALTTR
jgi:hypothetical protein